MKLVKFVLSVEPFSINKLHYRDGKIKTTEARDWERTVFHEMSKQEPQELIKQIRDIFDQQKHCFYVKLVCNIPDVKFFNKEGCISAKTMDLSNWEKPLIDLIFLPKYAEFSPPFGCPNLQADDRFITSLISRKKPTKSAKSSIEVSIKILRLDIHKRHLHTTD